MPWFALRKVRPTPIRRALRNATRRSALSMPINVAAVGDPGDEDETFGIVHRVDDAVIANANAEVIPTGKLYRARRTRINPEAIDRSCNAIGDGAAEPAVRPQRLRMEADVVLLARSYLL